VDGFPVVKNEVVGSNLPAPEKGVFYLVSAMVLAGFPERGDLLAPNTNEAKRNEMGHIVSVPGFVSNWHGPSFFFFRLHFFINTLRDKKLFFFYLIRFHKEVSIDRLNNSITSIHSCFKLNIRSIYFNWFKVM